MELFLEFVFTIAFSLLFSFVLAKLLSVATIDDHGRDFIKRKTAHCHNFHEDSRDYDWETERKLGFVSKIVGVDELDESKDDKVLAQQEISISPSLIREDELAREVEIVDLTEEDGECQKESIDESRRSEVEMDLIKEEVGIDKSEEIEIIKSDANCEISGDWEGIERSEMDRLFGAAVSYVGSTDNAHKISSLSSDVKLQLYGLHQVAIEGPCSVPQPMALKVSARAKWNAWQQLGNMSPEAAMEYYINLLSRSIPGWMKDDIAKEEHGKQDFADSDASISILSDLKTPLGNQQGALIDRSLEEQVPHHEGLDMVPNIKI